MAYDNTLVHYAIANICLYSLWEGTSYLTERERENYGQKISSLAEDVGKFALTRTLKYWYDVMLLLTQIVAFNQGVQRGMEVFGSHD